VYTISGLNWSAGQYNAKIFFAIESMFMLIFPQTSDMQWTYDIIGTTADYNPPDSRAKIQSSSATRRTVKQKKNYVLENLKLQSTAVSSPYKGIPLVSRSAR